MHEIEREKRQLGIVFSADRQRREIIGHENKKKKTVGRRCDAFPSVC